MNAILGYSQLLDQDAAGQLSKSHKQFVDEILRSGHHMLELINELLDLGRIENDDIPLEMKPCEPQSLVDNCVSMIMAVAEQSGISVQSRITSEGLPTVCVDSLRFRQAFLNLLSNAVKYGGEGSEVVVDCEARKSDAVRFSVTDNGPGISEDMRDRVVEPFERLGAENSSTPGTGIGLTVSKQLVERMGGNIGFESTVGEGTTFWIDVPTVHPDFDPLN
jgi:signal transduction histidine kinase